MADRAAAMAAARASAARAAADAAALVDAWVDAVAAWADGLVVATRADDLADAARATAWDAADAAQEAEFIRMLNCIENGIKYQINGEQV